MEDTSLQTRHAVPQVRRSSVAALILTAKPGEIPPPWAATNGWRRPLLPASRSLDLRASLQPSTSVQFLSLVRNHSTFGGTRTTCYSKMELTMVQHTRQIWSSPTST